MNGKCLPEMRVVTATSSVLHSGDKTKKKASRVVVETVDGEDVSAQNIPARAHIKGPPRKARAKKNAPKKAAPKKKAGAKPKAKKSAPKKK